MPHCAVLAEGAIIGGQMTTTGQDMPATTDCSNVTLRTAERRDAETIQSMIRALAQTTGDAHRVAGTAADLLRHGFGAEPLFDCVIAERDDQPVGLCLYFYSYSTWLGQPGVYVQDLYVADGERGRGTGQRLVAEVAARARTRHATHLRLTVDADNRNARAFYETIGMEHRDNEQTFHLGGDAFTRLAEAGQ